MLVKLNFTTIHESISLILYLKLTYLAIKTIFLDYAPIAFHLMSILKDNYAKEMWCYNHLITTKHKQTKHSILNLQKNTFSI